MKSQYLTEHLARVDLSFIKGHKKPIKQEQQPLNWDEDIKELKQFYNNIELPIKPIRLNQCSMILNAANFVDGHFAALKTYNGNSTFLPYLDRLRQFKEILLTH